MIYWIVLLVIIAYIFKSKKRNEFFLRTGFYIFIISALLNLVGITNIVEISLAISLIFLLVGFIMAVMDFLLTFGDPGRGRDN